MGWRNALPMDPNESMLMRLKALLAERGGEVSNWLAVLVLLALGVAAWSWLRRDAESSYVTTVVASQLLSLLLWDHYAMLLLLPLAMLLRAARPA